MVYITSDQEGPPVLIIERAAAHIVGAEAGLGDPEIIIMTPEDAATGGSIELERFPLPTSQSDAGVAAVDLENITGWQREDQDGPITYVGNDYVIVNVVRQSDSRIVAVRTATDHAEAADRARVEAIRVAFEAKLDRNYIAGAARMTRDGIYKLMKKEDVSTRETHDFSKATRVRNRVMGTVRARIQGTDNWIVPGRPEGVVTTSQLEALHEMEAVPEEQSSPDRCGRCGANDMRHLGGGYYECRQCDHGWDGPDSDAPPDPR